MEIEEKLIDWYKKNHRKLPWRETKNPYYIWISEVMLQQTRVDTVIDYYRRFVQQFPTIKDLAEAEEEAVLKAWEGLGYYSRAKRIHQAAKIIMEKYNCQMPRDYETLRRLPGIGSYTAGAIVSIAFHQPVAAVDGNVMRVFSRVFYIKEDITQSKTQKYMQKIGEKVVSQRNPSYYNQGLMELGALVCTPTSPRCLACPLFYLCEARELGEQEELPVKLKKPKPREVIMEMALVQKGEDFLITKRSGEGLLEGLWALPAVEKEAVLEGGRSIALELEKTFGMEVTNICYLQEKKHVFTHIKWKMRLYRMELVAEKKIDYPMIRWVSLKELENFPLPTAFKKLLTNI